MKTSRRNFLFAALLMFLLASGSWLTATEKRVALVIGNSNYKFNPILKNPVNDATDMAASLEKVGFTVNLLLDATRESMEKSVRDFGDKLKGEETIGLLYYSGHGAQAEGQNYLLPVDSDIRDEDELRFKAVDSEAILAKMRSAGNKLNIVVLDACRNNPFPGATRAAARGLSVVKVKVPESVIIYSTDPGSVASDGEGRNSPFTQAFLQQMEVPDQDVSIMMKRVSAKVQAATSGAQSPWVSSNLTRDFSFVTGTVQVKAVEAAPEAPRVTPTVVWVAANSTDPAERAWAAGVSPDGTPSFLIRSLYEGSLVPGKFNPKAKAAYIPYGGKENLVRTFELYVGPQTWLSSTTNQPIPPGALEVGYESDGSVLYAIRAASGKALVPGKLSSKTGQAYISLGGKEVVVTEYDVLISSLAKTSTPVTVSSSGPSSGTVIVDVLGELDVFDKNDGDSYTSKMDVEDFFADKGVTYTVTVDSPDFDTDLVLVNTEDGRVLRAAKSSSGKKTTLIFTSASTGFVSVQIKSDDKFWNRGKWSLRVLVR